MAIKKKSPKKARRNKGKKGSSTSSTSKNFWIGQGHLYQPEDENIRKDF